MIRVEKNTNYTTMSNYHLRDKNLTLKAKGLLSLFLSLPDSWKYSIKGLTTICKEGRDGITSAVDELERNGYLKRKQSRDKNGHFYDIAYIIYEQPQNMPVTENPITEKPLSVNPSPVNPTSGEPSSGEPSSENPAEISKEETNTEESITDSNKLLKDRGDQRYGSYRNVILSDADMAALKREFPGDYQDRIERLSLYMASKGKNYQNHLATIRDWARRDRQKNAGNSKTYSHDNYRFREGESL